MKAVKFCHASAVEHLRFVHFAKKKKKKKKAISRQIELVDELKMLISLGKLQTNCSNPRPLSPLFAESQELLMASR